MITERAAPVADAAYSARSFRLTESHVREAVLAVLIAASILLPRLEVSSSLPGVRAEQVLIVAAFALLALSARRQGFAVEFGWFDALFLALAASTAISIFYGRLALDLTLARRDFLELAKLFEYFLLFRFASAISDPDGSLLRRLLLALIAAGSVSAGLSVLQYFNAADVNGWLTPAFAPDHHLLALERGGRVVGTLGAPNDYGIFAAAIVIAAAALLTFARLERRQTYLVLAALGLAVLTLIMSLSRAATFGAIAALIWLSLLTLVWRRPHLARLTATYGAVALLVALSIGLLQAFPKPGSSFLDRFSSALTPSSDSTFGLRLLRWSDALRGGGGGSSEPTVGLVAEVHGTGAEPLDQQAVERDNQRKADLDLIVRGLVRYRDSHGSYPAEEEFPGALAPWSLPADVTTGEEYSYFSTGAAFALGAGLENEADPDHPVFGLGSLPNLVRNSSFESAGSDTASDWIPLGPSEYSVREGPLVLFDDRSAMYRNYEDTGRGGLYQQLFLGAPPGVTITASMSARLDRYEGGEFSLYAVGVYADGETVDPIARAPIDTSALYRWQRVVTTFDTDPDKSLAFLRVFALGQGFRGSARLDGVQLTAGEIPLSYARSVEGKPSDAVWGVDTKGFRDSPVFGVGPQKAVAGAAVDNEYIRYASRFGVVGFGLYVLMFFLPLGLGLVVFRRARAGPALALAAGLQGIIVAFLVFNTAAGTFYQQQITALYWILVGLLAAAAVAPLRPPRPGGAGKLRL